MRDHKTDGEKALEDSIAKLSDKARERLNEFLRESVNAKPKWWIKAGEEPSKDKP